MQKHPESPTILKNVLLLLEVTVTIRYSRFKKAFEKKNSLVIIRNTSPEYKFSGWCNTQINIKYSIIVLLYLKENKIPIFEKDSE